MFKQNRFIFLDILPGVPGRHRSRGMEVYSPKNYEKTPAGKLEKIERQISAEESQKVLENLNEILELKCLKCNSQNIQEDDANKNFYKFKCFDCGYDWKINKKVQKS